MDEKKITKMIKDALQLEEITIKSLQRVPAGMTNDSYFATINGEKYIVRIAGLGTEEIIDRKVEENNLIFGTSLGINPELIYFNATNGMKITRKIENATTLIPTLAREGHTMKHVISLFQHLHSTETPMENRFELFHLMEHYESLVKPVNSFIIEKLAPLKQEVTVLKLVYESLLVREAPCHIDPVFANIIRSGQEELYLIDWEYSGTFDPLWDLATLFFSMKFSEEEQSFFLTHYLGREANNEELQRLLIHTIFQDYLWSLWSFYKEAKGDNYGQEGIDRFERALENIALYKTLFQEDIVV